MSEKFPSQMQDKFTVRFPDGLRDAIAERAKRNGRSMNSEIVQILQDAVDSEGKGISAVAGIDVQEMHRLLDRVIEESLANKK
ncbi:Arc family DNA-binding protein [Cronobacter sakazakii]|nr:Arc family DNA-binding protein [Cronobacter sakazakii]PUX55595.1 Arc family DNA-binding protein [Cronobacter sakazakii]PUX58650.1 Arc family DNA-binding protein [Cronobacter sakazakii]PUX61545.1 Arc family DNA-binding protein [Cronobacter sakazakii]